MISLDVRVHRRQIVVKARSRGVCRIHVDCCGAMNL